MIVEDDIEALEGRAEFPAPSEDANQPLNDIDAVDVSERGRYLSNEIYLISVIIPCYNEGERIYRNLQECLRSLGELKKPFEIIAVNDGSSDNTLKELNRLAMVHPEVVPVTYGKNAGKGNALRVGTLKARGDLIIFMDADLEIHPRHAATFIKTMERTGADMVIGSKRHPYSKVDCPPKRRLLSYGYHIMVRALFGLKLTDTQPGFKLAKREVLIKEMYKSKVDRYAFDLELLVNADADGFKIVEAPIELNFSRPLGGRIGFRSVKSIFSETMDIFLRHRLNKSSDRIPKASAQKKLPDKDLQSP